MNTKRKSVSMSATQSPLYDQVDPSRVAVWLAEHVPDVELPLDINLVSGGRSNLTYTLTDPSGRRWVLRRPPTGHLLPTAHDVAREYKIITCLEPVGIPVPLAIGLCNDDSIIGVPFYVMAFVDGMIVRTADEAIQGLDVSARLQAGFALVETLATIHSVDPDAVGLGDFRRHDNYVARQLRRWYTQYQSTLADGGPHLRDIRTVHDQLAAHIPVPSTPVIVHGDFRIDNAVLDSQGNVVAILDWELCTIGDALADLAQFLVTWTEPGETSPLGHAPTTAPGFSTRSELVEHYALYSGRDIKTLDYYQAFAAWKLACILSGVYVRYVAGDMGEVDFDFSFYPDAIAALSATARALATHVQ